MNKLTTISLVLSFVISCVRVSAQDTIVLSLPDAIRIGVESSVDAAVARNEYISAYWGYKSYKAELLPEIGVSATLPYYSMSYNPIQNPADGSYTYTESNFSRIDGGVSVSQLIPFTGGKLSLSGNMQRLQQYGKDGRTNFMSNPYSITLEQPINGFSNERWMRKIEPVKYKEAMQKLVSENENVAGKVIDYYFYLLVARINHDIAVQNRDNSDKLYRIAETKREINRLSESELLQLKSSLLKAESALINAGEIENECMMQLRSLLHYDEKKIIVPVMPEGLPDEISALAYDNVLALAVENHSFTQNVQRRLLEASRDVNMAKSERWNAKLFVSYGMSGVDNSFSGAMNSAHWRNDRSVNVGISIPIVDWGKRKGKIAVAEANREVLQSRIEKEQMDFHQNIFVLVMNFNNQPKKLLLAKENDEVAQRRYQISVDAFILGKMDILNLNDSQNSKDEARREYINQMWALWDYYYQIRGLTLYNFANHQPLNTIEN